jgi:MFS family permease
MIWGALLMLLWAVLASFIAYLLSLWRALIAPCVVGLLVAPAILLPLAAASAMWGLRLPWRRLLQLIVEWRWWLGLIAATVMGIALPALLKASMQGDDIFWKMGLGPVVIGLLAMGSWLLLLGWLAVLFNRSLPHVKEELAEIPALTGPPEPDKQASVKLPLPEGE